MDIPSETEVAANIDEGLHLNANADNYLEWIVDLCDPYVFGEILEIGAGMGDFTPYFAKKGRVLATELHRNGIERLSRRFSSTPEVQVGQFNIFSQPERQFDVIILINVLEHMPDDEASLEALRNHLKPNGKLVIYVPAFWLLYSNFDRSIGHYRRYRKEEVVTIAERAGFRRMDARYVNALGAVGWFVYCRLLKRKASEGASVGIMNKIIIPMMRSIEDRIRLPFGVSIFYVGEKV